jgi:hypothetical protein
MWIGDYMKEKNIRRKIYFFICSKILKVPEGEYVPKKYSWIANMLFPFETYAIKCAQIKYDYYRDVFEIYGTQYSGDFFRTLSSNIKNPFIKQIERTEDGTIFVTNILTTRPPNNG